MEDVLLSKYLKFRPFVPDFSLRVSEKVQILRIRRQHWLAAVRTNFFQNKQKTSDDPPMLTVNGEPIDLLQQELEKANCADPSETNIAWPGETDNDNRDRATSLSLAPRMGSTRSITGHNFFNRFRSRSGSRHTDRTYPENRMVSHLNVPNSTDK